PAPSIDPRPITTASAAPRRRCNPSGVPVPVVSDITAPSRASKLNQNDLIYLVLSSGDEVGASTCPGLRAVGRPPGAVAAARGAVRRRLSGPGDGVTGRGAAEPRLLSPPPAPRRRAGAGFPQQLRRPRQLLPPRPRPVHRDAGRRRCRT